MKSNDLIFQKKSGFAVCIAYYLIILSIFSCSPLKKAQDSNLIQYDSLTRRKVYTFVEEMPHYKGGNRAFINDFCQNFHFKFREHEDIQTKLQVQFVINKKGHLIGARIYKKEEELTRFEKEGLEILKSMQNWQSGKHKNKKVDVIVTMLINVGLLY